MSLYCHSPPVHTITTPALLLHHKVHSRSLRLLDCPRQFYSSCSKNAKETKLDSNMAWNPTCHCIAEFTTTRLSIRSSRRHCYNITKCSHPFIATIRQQLYSSTAHVPKTLKKQSLMPTCPGIQRVIVLPS